jgi:hypothetical protein
MAPYSRGGVINPLLSRNKPQIKKNKTGTCFTNLNIVSRGVEEWIFIEVNPISYNTQFSKDVGKFQDFQKQMYYYLKTVINLQVPKDCRYSLTIEINKHGQKADSSNYHKPIEDVIKHFGSDDSNCEHFQVCKRNVDSPELNGVRLMIIPLVKNWKVKSNFTNKKYKNTHLISVCNQMTALSKDEFFIKKGRKTTKKTTNKFKKQL